MSTQYAIRKISNNVFDVFIETGWENWTRIRKVFDRMHKRVHLIPIAGKVSLPRHIWEDLKNSPEVN